MEAMLSEQAEIQYEAVQKNGQESVFRTEDGHDPFPEQSGQIQGEVEEMPAE